MKTKDSTLFGLLWNSIVANDFGFAINPNAINNEVLKNILKKVESSLCKELTLLEMFQLSEILEYARMYYEKIGCKNLAKNIMQVQEKIKLELK